MLRGLRLRLATLGAALPLSRKSWVRRSDQTRQQNLRFRDSLREPPAFAQPQA